MEDKVQCQNTACGAYDFCSHAVPHVERDNCYNNGLVNLFGHPQRVACPKCYPVENKD